MPLALEISAADDRTSRSDRRLARVAFGSSHEIGEDPRDIRIGLPPLDGCALAECWRSERPVETGRHGEIAFAGDGHVFFGHVLLEESRSVDLDSIGHHAYSAILDWLEAFGGLHLLRVWNYVPSINRIDAGLERYRSFCVGRSRALADREIAEQALPAASGVGSAAAGLMISFLAAADAGRQVENPRQVSAFRYPRQYGPRSPSFSRALVYRQRDDRSLLFISGTASIVGHETRHAGSLGEQCAETFRNIAAVSMNAGGDHRPRALRVYIRHPEHTDDILAHCRRHFGADTPIIPLSSAICRQDLLVEIEGVASDGHPSGEAKVASGRS